MPCSSWTGVCQLLHHRAKGILLFISQKQPVMLCALLLPWRSDFVFFAFTTGTRAACTASCSNACPARGRRGNTLAHHLLSCIHVPSSIFHLQASDFLACDLLLHAQASTLELCLSDTCGYNSQTKRFMAYTCGLLLVSLVDMLKSLLGLLFYVQIQLFVCQTRFAFLAF